MTRNNYFILSETTEDRFDETDTLEEAVRIVQEWSNCQVDDAISIGYEGKVIHQFVRTTSGFADLTLE